MPITEGEWQSISALIERVVSQTGSGGTASVLTTSVVKVDEAKKVIYVPEFGDQPIPLVDFEGEGRIYDADIPIGAVVQSSGATVPDNYLPANGQAVSRTQYSELFAAIGTTYGAGDGSTTFNVPFVPGGGGSVPIGSPIPWLVTAIPAGYLEFNGQPITNAAYPILFGLFGANL